MLFALRRRLEEYEGTVRGGTDHAVEALPGTAIYVPVSDMPNIDSVTDPWHAHISPIRHKASSKIW